MSQSQGPILKLIDFVDDIVSVGPKFRQNMTILVTYILFAATGLSSWHHLSDKDFSFLLTFSGCTQTLGFFLLLHKIRVQRSVAGISSKTLQVYVFVFLFRLSSTMVKNGYLPVDRTGDWLYQASDVASLLLVLQILFFMHKKYSDTYQHELDTMPIGTMLPAFALLGCAFHGNLNHSPFFDKTWTIGMWLDSIAMLPQLWMLVSKGGKVEALTANFVALIFLSRLMTWFFWFSGYDELAPKEGGKFTGGFNKVGMLIMTGQSLSLVVSGDFMYHYFKWQSANFWGMLCKRADAKPVDDGMVLPGLGMEMEV